VFIQNKKPPSNKKQRGKYHPTRMLHVVFYKSLWRSLWFLSILKSTRRWFVYSASYKRETILIAYKDDTHATKAWRSPS